MVFDQAKTMKIASTLGWFAIALSVLIMLASGASRLALMTQDPLNSDGVDVRYIQHQWVSLLHIVPGVLFLTLAPLQFFARIRQRRISIHRGLGRILATCAAISGVIVLILNFLFPTFGGISTQSATAFFGVIFLFSLFMAMCHMLRRSAPASRVDDSNIFLGDGRSYSTSLPHSIAVAYGTEPRGVIRCLFLAGVQRQSGCSGGMNQSHSPLKSDG